MDTTNLALAKFDATDAELLAMEQEIHPVREEKGRFTKTLLNGTESRMDQQAKGAKAKGNNTYQNKFARASRFLATGRHIRLRVMVKG